MKHPEKFHSDSVGRRRLESDRREALALLWTQSQNLVEAFLRTMVSSPHDRDDLLQETAKQAARYFDRYDSTRPFAGWVIGIARNNVIDLRRKSAKEGQLIGVHSIEEISDLFVRMHGEISERAIALDACLKKVQPQHRELLKLRYNDSMKVQEIAQQVGSRPNTVSVSLKRIRLALANCISGELGRMKGGDHA